MTPELKKFIDLLESELGYADKGGAYTKFGDWYGKNVEFDADYSSAPWCDMYLSWAAHKLGYEEWVGQFAWTVAHAEWFQEQDAWGTEPEPGAFVFYDWGGSDDVDRIDHVGIVTKVVGDKIFTIEGNIDGGVAKRKERDTSKVVGYGYPAKIKARLDKQAEEQVRKEQEATEAKASVGTDVGRLDLPEPGLRSLLPQVTPADEAHPPQATSAEGARPPLAAGPQSTAAPTPATTTAAATAKRSTAPGTPSQTGEQRAKKGKHAKPATADTNATTTAPLPAIVDASAGTPAPALDTPALVGSALITALAVLTVAKTRRLRVRSAATAPALAPKRGRRRRPRRGFTLTAVAIPRKAALPEAELQTAESRKSEPGKTALSTGETLLLDISQASPDIARQPAPLDAAHYTFTEDTGALPRFTEDTGALPGATGAASADLDLLTARALEKLDAATARAFAPFAPFTPRVPPARHTPERPSAYHGRRRRAELPAELTVPRAPALSGGRHRV